MTVHTARAKTRPEDHSAAATQLYGQAARLPDIGQLFGILVSGSANEHTPRLIFLPSSSSCGRTCKNSRKHATLSGLVPSVDTINGRTSFQDSIWMARLARATDSCVRMGFGPLLYVRSSSRRESRNCIWESAGNCEKSIFICHISTCFTAGGTFAAHLALQHGCCKHLALDRCARIL